MSSVPVVQAVSLVLIFVFFDVFVYVLKSSAFPFPKFNAPFFFFFCVLAQRAYACALLHVSECISAMPFPVVLRLYDLSHGMARELSPSLLGQQIDGIWHTGVFVYGREYFYGGGGAGAGTESGISSARGSEFSLNQGIRPVKEIPLGTTNKSQQEFESFLQRIAGRFRVCDYSLFHHNCNNFSDAVSQFLVGHPIPEYITGLPARVLATPMGAALQPLMDNFNNNFQTQIATPQSQQSLRHYGAESTTAPPVPAHDGARGNDEAEAQAALDAALAAMSDPLESSTTTSTTTTTTTAARPDGSTTTTTKSETVVTSTTRPSACPLSVFDDRSLVPGMVRRLTNLGSHFMSVHPNFDAVLKAVRCCACPAHYFVLCSFRLFTGIDHSCLSRVHMSISCVLQANHLLLSLSRARAH